MTVAEAGRKGGQVVKQKYGPEFYGQIGKKGGSTTKAKYGPDHYSQIGRRGGRFAVRIQPISPAFSLLGRCAIKAAAPLRGVRGER